MILKAIILDLDNTIYPVHAIGDALFNDLFRMLEESGELGDRLGDAKKEIMRRPFQMVAREFGFSEALTKQGVEHLQQLEYKGPIEPFPDFGIIRAIDADKFLVTTGFPNLQNSKVDGMQLREDFIEIHIVDPQSSPLTKKDVFADILRRHGYAPHDVLVVGDDPASEIKAGLELGLPVIMYDALGLHPGATGIRRITNYTELTNIIS